MKNKKKIEWEKIIIKLFFDAFFVLTALFGITFLGEALIPGIITNKIGWRYLILFLIFNLVAIFYLSSKYNLCFSDNFWLNKKNISFWIIFVGLVFLGSFWRGNLLSFFVSIVSTFLIFLFVRIAKEN